MAKKNGHMLVQYRASKPELFYGEELRASGRRTHISPNHSGIKAWLDYYYKVSIEDYKVIRKDLRSGWFIVDTPTDRMMFAVMPYSNKKISDVML